MPTLPHLAATLQEVVTTTAAAAGHTSGFVHRRSPLDGATFTQTLLFGFLASPAPTLEDLAQTAATLGVPISPQALDQRFTPYAAACLYTVLTQAVTRVVAADPVAVPLLDRFTAVVIHDSSTISLPAALAARWSGCGGGRSATHTTAALKLHVGLDLRTGALCGPQLHPGRTADHTMARPLQVPRGALRLADLGYWSLDDLALLHQQGVYWLSRLQAATAVYDEDGQRADVLGLLEAQHADRVDLPIQLGWTHRLGARLLAVRVPQEVADQRRRRLRADARRKGTAVAAQRLALASWTVLVTNVPPEQLSVDEALVVARCRWQIELLFKLWKSHGRIDESRSHKPWRLLCEVYAKLLAMVVQHWLLVVSCWAYADRSLAKAAQTVRKHALHLASMLGDTAHLQRAIGTIARCLQTGCRLNRRKQAPNHAQLLLAFTDAPP